MPNKDDYSDAPTSITELRAAKEHDASQWTPRDMLISLLREIDSGECNISEIVCIYVDEEDRIMTAQAVKHVMKAFGMIEMGKLIILSASHVDN